MKSPVAKGAVLAADGARADAARACRLITPVIALSLFLLPAAGVGAQSLSARDLEQMLAPRKVSRDTRRVDELVNRLSGADRQQPMWPVYEFLAGELLRENGRERDAARRYWNLVQYAATDPYEDTWGCSGLVTFALYRWLEIEEGVDRIDPKEVASMAGWSDALLQTRLVRSAFGAHPILPSLPLLEEEIYYKLASVARRAGLRDLAGTYFLGYLSRLRSVNPPAEFDPLYDLVLEAGISTPDRIALFRGRRLWSLGMNSEAIPYFKQAAESRDERIRLEGSFLLARASGRRMTRSEKQRIYEHVHRYASRDDLAQEALFWNALQYGPGEVELQQGLVRLIREYDSGAWRDDAYFWLAKTEQIAGNLDESLDLYRRLREIEEDNDFVSRAAILPALALIFRGAPGDAAKAREILSEFVQKHPDLQERPLAQFWLGRIAEDQGDRAEAVRNFNETVKVDPLGYYGLRSRMHLADRKAARGQSFIANRALRQELVAKYGVSASGSLAENRSAYAQRVDTTLANGFYRLALEGEQLLRGADASKRLPDFTFEELDELGLMTRLAVMMALRQDALAAGDASGAVAERIPLAQRMGAAAADWPSAMSLVHPSVLRLTHRRAELMESSGYLASAYPEVYPEVVQSATRGKAVSPAILYAVMRQESFFYSAALSPAGALGLFQFMPGTFADQDRKWDLLATAQTPTRQSYLLNPKLSLELASRWFAEEKLPEFDHEPLLAILAHHSGDGRVRKWRRIWGEKGWRDDVELMIESFRKPELDSRERVGWGVESRRFARQVMTDLAIVEALGLYSSGEAEASGAQ